LFELPRHATLDSNNQPVVLSKQKAPLLAGLIANEAV